MPLANVSYHLATLAQAGVIQEVRQEPRRGAVEHFYAFGGRNADALAAVLGSLEES